MGLRGSPLGIQLDTECLWRSGFRCSALGDPAWQRICLQIVGLWGSPLGIQPDRECLWESGFEVFSSGDTAWQRMSLEKWVWRVLRCVSSLTQNVFGKVGYEGSYHHAVLSYEGLDVPTCEMWLCCCTENFSARCHSLLTAPTTHTNDSGNRS